jgi:inner membrane protein
MSPITHFLVGWAVILPATLERRDRALVVLASVAPDLDGLVVLADLARGKPAESLDLWSRYHHVLAHNLTFALAAAVACYLASRRKLVVCGLTLLVVHLHFLCDVVGSRGPDGYQWPIPYLWPFSTSWQLAVRWQWALNAWPNIVFTIGLLALTLYAAWARGVSPVRLFSVRADQLLFATLRQRIGSPARHTHER